MSIKILLADDHSIMREGLRALLEKEHDMEVIGEANNGRVAVEMTRELSPHVVIMDVTMPNLNGIDATRQIKAENSGVQIVALSMHSDPRFVMRMLRIGASGYLLKDCAFEELHNAVRTVSANKTYLSSDILNILVKNYLQNSKEAGSSELARLSSREHEVLQLLSEGKTVKHIADHLFISVKTAETHRKRIMDKLDIRNVAELTKYAIREGLTSLEK
jgi:DNA-binding NarL/FixJ family response regulator